jgi:hypothetical protein
MSKPRRQRPPRIYQLVQTEEENLRQLAALFEAPKKPTSDVAAPATDVASASIPNDIASGIPIEAPEQIPDRP